MEEAGGGDRQPKRRDGSQWEGWGARRYGFFAPASPASPRHRAGGGGVAAAGEDLGNLPEAAYIVRLLLPYFENFGKRVIKSPKLYFLDSAPICALTSQPGGKAALAGALGGSLFEGLIVSEAFKVFALRGKRPDLYFWRSHDGSEVDLVLRLPRGLVPVEIKLTATPTLKHAEVLRKFRDLAGREAAPGGVLVCNVKERVELSGGNVALPWWPFPEWLGREVGG